MLDLNDARWPELKGGYRVPIDIRPLLLQLESTTNSETIWSALWQELYHQGDVGEASFVAVPHLVRIHRNRGVVDWSTYGLAATIELARGSGGNPDVPLWAREAYEESLRDLARLGLEELPRASDSETVRCILALVAIVYGARTHGRLLLEFNEDEILEMEKVAFGSQENAENDLT